MSRIDKLIFGVGVNDLPHGSCTYRREDGKCAEHLFYRKYKDLLTRCYSEKARHKNLSYEKCEICDEWKVLSVFKEWFERNNVEGWQLDKDFLNPGNTIYSPENCVFLPQVINSFVKVKSLEKDSLAGASPAGNKFRAQCKNPLLKNRGCLGLFSTKEEAHEAWRKEKDRCANLLADHFPTLDPRASERLRTLYKLQ